jgi:hypothetical protein
MCKWRYTEEGGRTIVVRISLILASDLEDGSKRFATVLQVCPRDVVSGGEILASLPASLWKRKTYRQVHVPAFSM